MAQHAEDDRKSFDHGKNVHKTHYHIKGVDDVIEINSDSDSDYDKDGNCIPIMVKIEDSDSRDYGYEEDPYANRDAVLIEDINEG